MNLYDKNRNYWTGRTMGYSKVNEEELKSGQKEKWLNLLTRALPKAEHGCKVLDMGTGPGFFAILLAEAGYDVTAADCTDSMLERAKCNAGIYKDRINWVLSDAQKTGFKEELFDAVVSRNLTWNLEHPETAYEEWLRILKKGGVLLNFDANWYQHLFDQKMREGYERDRNLVLEQKLEDHYTCTDIDAMEEIAKMLPMGKVNRPQWDREVLYQLKASSIKTDESVWKEVWSEEETVNYGSTPMFFIQAVK